VGVHVDVDDKFGVAGSAEGKDFRVMEICGRDLAPAVEIGERFEQLLETFSVPGTAVKLNKRMAKEQTALGKSLKRCGRILALAATALGIGIGLITIGLAWTLF
jgi:hypothetical protein